MNERTILQGVAEVHRQGEVLLRTLDDAAYARSVPGAYHASVGSHYRHCLDHFQSLLDALQADEVNYDLRKRDRRVETERAFAAAETSRIFRDIEAIPEGALTRPLRARTKVGSGDGEAPAMPSTLGRELMYAAVHAVHHYALIGVICGMQGVTLPPGFGVAPSTLKHQAEGAGAS